MGIITRVRSMNNSTPTRTMFPFFRQQPRRTPRRMSVLVSALILTLSCLQPMSSSSSTALARASRSAPRSRTHTRQRQVPWSRLLLRTKTSSSSIIDTSSKPYINPAVTGFKREVVSCGKDETCFILDYELDFEDECRNLDDSSDNILVNQRLLFENDANESQLKYRADNYSFRGGAAAAPGTERRLLRGLHSGWRRKCNQQQQQLFQRPSRNKSQRATDKSIQLRHNLQKIDNLHQQKMHQVRRAFRRKQREFHNAIYNLNSRFNSFPKPPYNLWTLDRTQLQQRGRGGQQVIGKTTLTGKIFLFNIIMFGLQTIYPQLTSWGAKRSDMILEGRQLHRLLTPVFLHGGLGHLMANSYSLKSMGANVEMAFGPSRLLATYLVSGIMGNLMSAIQSPNPAVGASGAIFGLVGAYYTFLARNQELFGYTGQMQKNALVETIGFNLLLGMTNPMIDNWGHIGGFVGGVGMAYLIGPKLYVARVPLLGSGAKDSSLAAGFSAGKVIIDRPTISLRTPEFVNEGIFWIDDQARKLGRRVSTCASNLFRGKRRGDHEYYFDAIVDYCNGIGSNGICDDIDDADGTIFRTLKENEDIQLGGNVVVNPSDGFRQSVSELDPTNRRLSRRRRAPAAGRSIRPRYGHLYR